MRCVNLDPTLTAKIVTRETGVFLQNRDAMNWRGQLLDTVTDSKQIHDPAGGVTESGRRKSSV